MKPFSAPKNPYARFCKGLPMLMLLLLGACLASTPDWQRTELPNLVIPAPTRAADRNYLGLSPDAENFTLDQLRGKLVVLEFILVQCPHCQHEAPKMKAFYELVRARGLDDRIKFCGIALGNTALETGLFRERYQVPFPLIPNPGKHVMKIEATPTLYFLRPAEGDAAKIIYEAVGRLPDPEKMLQLAIARGDLEPS